MNDPRRTAAGPQRDDRGLVNRSWYAASITTARAPVHHPEPVWSMAIPNSPSAWMNRALKASASKAPSVRFLGLLGINLDLHVQTCFDGGLCAATREAW